MSDKPENCPYPRSCPMESREFIERMAKIENELAENREKRHEKNAQINRIIDEERLERINLENLVKENTILTNRFLKLVEGEFGEPGLIRHIHNNTNRLKELENWRHGQKGFISGIIAVTSFIGILIGFLIQMFFGT